MQQDAFWEGITLTALEDLRARLRGLVPFLDRKKRRIVYTDFQDEVLGVRHELAVSIPRMTGAQYEKKVNDYLRHHQDHLFIELIIDQLTARGVMEESALYEPPFSHLHAGGPEALFAGKKNVIDAVFRTLESFEPQVQEGVG